MPTNRKYFCGFKGIVTESKVLYGRWENKFLWIPTDINWYGLNHNAKSKFRWLITVYRRSIELEYPESGINYKTNEYAESLLEIIKRDYEKTS